jgi:glutamyl-tRNA synthetase
VNFIALLGWNPTGDREVYDFQELIDMFRLEKVNKAGAVFDLKKLDWMNTEYIKKTSNDDLYKMLQPVLEEKDILKEEKYIKDIIELFKERIVFVSDIPDIAPYMFDKPQEYDQKYINKRWKEDSPEITRDLLAILRKINEFDHDNINSKVKEYCDEKDLKLGVVIHPLRLTITGMSSGASMFHTMEILGKDECIERIEIFLDKWNNNEIKK